MPKPVCCKCERFMRPKKTGAYMIEGKPRSNDSPPGKSAPEQWTPYKVWIGDIYACPECGVEMMVGFGRDPCAYDHEREKMKYWLEVATTARRHHIVNDC